MPERTTAACTIASKNYLSYVRVLAESYLANNPGSRFILLLADRVDGYFDPAGEKFDVVLLDDIPLPDRERFCFQYTVIELNTAVKPFFIKHLFDKYPIDRLVYLDPDILVTDSFDELFEAMDTHPVTLTPHFTTPYSDNASPSEMDTLNVGVYNLGFIGLKRGAVVDGMLTWWQERLLNGCRHAVEMGMFVDQKWMELAPCYVENVRILREPGYNVAYWNLHERTVEGTPGGFTVNGQPLRFYHFSGIDINDPELLSKYQNRFELKDVMGVRPLFDLYREKVLARGYKDTKGWPYAFGRFSDGKRITDLHRYVYMELGDGAREFGDPFDAGRPGSYRGWFERNYVNAVKETYEPDRLMKLFTAVHKMCPGIIKSAANKSLGVPFSLMRFIAKSAGYESQWQKLSGPAPQAPDVQRHPLVPGRSETSRCRHRLAQYCVGYGVDVGYGGDPIKETAITVDMPVPYTRVGAHPLNLGGDARDLRWFQSGSLDFVFSSHVLEDFDDTGAVVREWLRVLRPGGRLVLYLPDEQAYRRHCKETGQDYNANHKIEFFSLKYLRDILDRFDNVKVIHEAPLVEDYSFEIVVEKTA